MKSIFILGLLWTDKINGNTYHSSEVFIDGKMVGKVTMEYGNGDQFEWTGADILKGKRGKKNYLRGQLPDEFLWKYCDRKKITLTTRRIEVKRQRDL
jgi:hypothetical protein